MNDIKIYWNEAKPLQLPFVYSPSFTVSDFVGNCTCGKQLTEIRGTINEVFKCVEIEAAGVYLTCEIIVPLRIRIYPEEKRYLTFVEGEWREGKYKMGRNWFKLIFGVLTSWYKKIITDKKEKQE